VAAIAGRPAATLHGVVFDILGARTFQGEFSTITAVMPVSRIAGPPFELDLNGCQKPSTRSCCLLTWSAGSIDCALRKSAIASVRRPTTS